MTRGRCISWLTLCLGSHLGLTGCGAGTGPTAQNAAQHETTKAKPTQPSVALAQARAALREGRYADAERELEAAVQRGLSGSARLEALRAVAEVRLLTGRPAEAVDVLATDEGVEGVALRVAALRALGRIEEALSLAADRSTAPGLDRQRLALLRGDVLIEWGRRSEALEPLLFAAEQAPVLAGQHKKDAAVAWTRGGRAAHLMRQVELANELYNRAEIAGGSSLELLLARFELYLGTHDVAHAEEVLSEASRSHPHHPEVLYAEARLHLEAALDFAHAEELCARILKINPESSDARFLLAGGALRDFDFEKAESYIQAALALNPRDLRALSMRAGVRFLAEDPEGFEEVVEHVLSLSPGYTQLFSTVGQFAEWEHRYPDIEKLMRRAARLDPKDAEVRTLLGLTLVRAGSDPAGLVELRRAYELDPFNVRVVNTLNLYEKTIPRDYKEFTQGPFRFRFPRAESALLERYVPQLLERAHQEMVSRYGFTPLSPIGIEIYATEDAFAVRTSGLPQTPIAGVCFGRKLATVSPVGSPGNLGMTLWHELGHVFHIGLSDYRVPRWLTEGMAEWETAHLGVGWSRELDRELVQTLEAKALPPLRHMSRAFTQARFHQDVASAYYASGLISEWLVETRGEQAPVSVLRELGRHRLTDEVVPEVLGESWSQLDAKFHGWLAKRLDRFTDQFIPALVRSSLDEAEAALRAAPDDGARKGNYAHALLAEGKVDDALSVLTTVKAYDGQAHYLLARIALAQGKLARAAQLLGEMIQRGDDGYEVRIVLARSLLAQKNEGDAEAQLKKARAFDPQAEEPLALLAALYRKRTDTASEIDVLRSWAPLAEHEGFIHHRLITLLHQEEEFAEAARIAEWSVWADLASVDAHRLAALSWSRSGQRARADFEWESALLCPGTAAEFRKLEQTWAEELTRLGQRGRVSEMQKRVAEAILKWGGDVEPMPTP